MKAWNSAIVRKSPGLNRKFPIGTGHPTTFATLNFNFSYVQKQYKSLFSPYSKNRTLKGRETLTASLLQQKRQCILMKEYVQLASTAAVTTHVVW